MRYKRTTKRLSTLIQQQNSLLGKLFHKAEVLQEINHQVQQMLPPAMAGQIRVANINRREIVIHIRSAALLTRLRLQQVSLMQKINQQYSWAAIEKVHLKVRPARYTGSTPEEPVLRRSEAMASSVDFAAENCSHQSLRSSLQRLAGHIRQPDASETDT